WPPAVKEQLIPAAAPTQPVIARAPSWSPARQALGAVRLLAFLQATSTTVVPFTTALAGLPPASVQPFAILTVKCTVPAGPPGAVKAPGGPQTPAVQVGLTSGVMLINAAHCACACALGAQRSVAPRTKSNASPTVVAKPLLEPWTFSAPLLPINRPPPWL